VSPLTGQWRHRRQLRRATARFSNGAEGGSKAFSGTIGTSNIGGSATARSGLLRRRHRRDSRHDRALGTAELRRHGQPLGITDPGAPTPGSLALTGSTATSISLGWTASTDDTGVTGYHVFADGAAAGTTSATSFTVTGLSCSTGHQLEVEAFDAAGNTSPRASVSGSTTSCGASPGVAAYAFDEEPELLQRCLRQRQGGTISGTSW
jgi:hypothetical protein